MKVYIDSEYRCHTSKPDGVYREVEVSFFDNKCDTYIEGYRYIPPGETWIQSDGFVFDGESVTPWKPSDELDDAQREYEQKKLKEYEEALKVVGVTV